MIVVADTSPINYLILTRQIDLLPRLYGNVLIPPAVLKELSDPLAPESVQLWLAEGVNWVGVRTPERIPDDFPTLLGPGEREAIALSQECGAAVLLMDERDGRQEAIRRHLTVIGTLGVLGEAADRNWVDLPAAVAALKATSFRANDILYHEILVRYEQRKRSKIP